MNELNDREQFRKVDTGNGFSNNLAATTNDRLELTVIELQNLQVNNSQQTKKLDSRLRKLDRSIKSLNETIVTANIKNDYIQRWFLTLSILGALFAALGIFQVADILIRGLGK